MNDPDVALDLRPAPKTEPLFDVGTDLDDGVAPWIVVAGVVVLAALVAVVLRAVL